LSLRKSNIDLFTVAQKYITKIAWFYEDFLQFKNLGYVSHNITECANLLNDFSLVHDFKQFYPVHDKKKYTLDLLLSDLDFKRIESMDYLVEVDKDHHFPQFFSISLNTFQEVLYNNIQYNYKNFIYICFNLYIILYLIVICKRVLYPSNLIK